jgi:hypothetical protein
MVHRSIPGRFIVSRRRFLASAAAAGAGLLVPGARFTQVRAAAQEERIVTAHVGMGRRGRELLRHLKPYARAVCDVDRNHLREGLEIAAPGTEAFSDYHVLLERPDITAIVIAVPNHWHGQMAIDACAAGKDVYLEAPAAFYLDECIRLVRTARQFGVLVAVGASTLLSADEPQDAVSPWTAVGAANPSGGEPGSMMDAPATLDWQRWLGPAPWHPYNSDYCHDTWRWMLAFGGGRLMTEGVGEIQRFLAALPELPKRVRVIASGTASPADLWDCPTSFQVRYQLEPSGQELVWEQALESQASTVPPADSDAAAAAERWIESLRNRTPPPVSLETACQAAAWGILGNMAYRLCRPLLWDLESRSFVDDPQANRLLTAPVPGVVLQ